MSYFPPILKDPQLAIPQSDRNLILRAAYSAWFKKRTNLALYMAIIITWSIGMVLATVYLDHLTNNATLYAVLIWTTALPLYFGLNYLIFRLAFRVYIYKELHNRGHDICLTCGYILIDIPISNTKCPECGTPRSAPLKPAAD